VAYPIFRQAAWRALAILWAALGLWGCEQAELPTLADAGVRPDPELALDVDADDQLLELTDTRELRAFPNRYLGHLVDCELRHIGPLRATPVADLRLRELGLSHSRSARCAAGFIELGFRPSSSALAAFVRPGQSVRARVLDSGRERGGIPILDFVAQREGQTTVSATDADDPLFDPLEVGADLRPAAIGRPGQAPLDCVVSWIGAPETSAAVATEQPTFHAPLSCHRATGDAWVELELRAAEVEAALSLRRGDHLSLRITSLSGGRGRYPMARRAN